MRNLLRNDIVPIRLRIAGLIIFNLFCSIYQMRYNLRMTLLNPNTSLLGNFYNLTDFLFLRSIILICLNYIINKIVLVINLNGLCITKINLIAKSILVFFFSQGNTLMILITEFQLMIIIRLLAHTIPLKNIIFSQTILVTIMFANGIRFVIGLMTIFVNIFAFG